MNLRIFQPAHALRGYIHRMWVFESPCGLPVEDMRLLVPDGRLLLLIPFMNGITGQMGGREYLVKEHDMSLVGITDLPSIIDARFSGALSIIGVDFNPMGAYRFFHWPLKDVKYQVASLLDILGKTANQIQQQIEDAATVSEKVELVQQFLLNLFVGNAHDAVFEYCVKRIHESRGAIKVKQLVQETGYSSRWLNRKFDESLGISPKNFSSITRFQFYYHGLLANASGIIKHKEFYNHYYDESHFIREFKRFTGMPPSRFENAINRFGRLFQ